MSLKPVSEHLLYQKSDPKDQRLGQFVHRMHFQKDLDQIRDGVFVIVGWGDDRGVGLNGGRLGAKEGPDAIRSALYRCTPGVHGEILHQPILDFGNLSISSDLNADHSFAADFVEEVYKRGATLLPLGGGNDYAYADGLGLKKGMGANQTLGAINIDAHYDVRDMRMGPSSGTPYFRLLEETPKVLMPAYFVEFAAQSQCNSPIYHQYLQNLGSSIVSLEECQSSSPKLSFSKSLHRLSSQCDAVMVSLDMDSVKQSDAPGVSAPSPNGLTAQDVEEIALLAGRESKVRLFSIYEVCPALDLDQRTAKLAALAIWKFIQARNRVS